MKGSLYQIYVLLLLSFCLIGCSTSKKVSKSKRTKKHIKKKISGIHFVHNTDMELMTLLEKAEKEQKLVFVEFYADWCLPCKLMEEEVFTKREVYSLMNQHFLSYKVDIEKANGGNLKFLFGAEELPTLVFLNAKGQTLKKHNGVAMEGPFMNLVKGVLRNQ